MITSKITCVISQNACFRAQALSLSQDDHFWVKNLVMSHGACFRALIDSIDLNPCLRAQYSLKVSACFFMLTLGPKDP